MDQLNISEDDYMFELVYTPHEARWTTYKNGDVYWGLVQHYSMDPCGSEYPFKMFPDEQKFNDTLTKMFPGRKAKYFIIPDDCNCCS